MNAWERQITGALPVGIDQGLLYSAVVVGGTRMLDGVVYTNRKPITPTVNVRLDRSPRRARTTGVIGLSSKREEIHL